MDKPTETAKGQQRQQRASTIYLRRSSEYEKKSRNGDYELSEGTTTATKQRKTKAQTR